MMLFLRADTAQSCAPGSNLMNPRGKMILCLHYLLLIFLLFVVVASASDEGRLSTPTGNCSLLDDGKGKGNAGGPMIINGEPVPAGEARYQLALLRSGTFICGAALIAPRTAITAGHCVHGFDLTSSLFSVRFGSLNLTDTAMKVVTVQRVVLHPAFTSATYNADLALLILSERVHLDDSVGLIEISSEEEFPVEGSLITVQGWGQTSTGTLSEWLMRARLTVIGVERCRTAWAADGQPVLPETMFCATGKQQSSCKGDSGGPVLSSKPGEVEGKLVGVVSWGSRYCLDERFPNVYARVTGRVIRGWIDLNTVH